MLEHPVQDARPAVRELPKALWQCPSSLGIEDYEEAHPREPVGRMLHWQLADARPRGSSDRLWSRLLGIFLVRVGISRLSST